ncbi:MAG: type II secretion system protein [Bacilli bacterium]
MKILKYKKGFTLTELMVVISITGILFTVLAVLLSKFVMTNRKLNIKNKIANEVYEIDLLLENTVNSLNIEGLSVYINEIEKEIYSIDLISGEKKVYFSFSNSERTSVIFGDTYKNLQYIDNILFIRTGHLLSLKMCYNEQTYERSYYLLKVGEME